jgi:hypothetical protein
MNELSLPSYYGKVAFDGDAFQDKGEVLEPSLQPVMKLTARQIRPQSTPHNAAN